MARTREFDEGQVLSGAMHAFRQHGFQRISIRDLEAATGLAAGSIYNSFGDKAGLFEAAFRHYNAAALGRRIATFAPPAEGAIGLQRLFLSLLDADDRFGCLITNSAIEFGGGATAPAALQDGLETLSSTFVDRLLVSEARGELAPGVEPHAAGSRLLALYQGVLVLFRAGRPLEELRRLVLDEFRGLIRSTDYTQ